MSTLRLATRKPQHLRRLPILAALALFLAQGSPAGATCGTSTAVTLNATYRGSGTELLKATTGGAGVLVLDVSTAGAAAQPKITFLGTDCETPTGEGTDFDIVEETPQWLALDVHSADTYFWKVEPQNPLQTLSAFKLRAAWIADPSTPDEDNTLTSDATDTCSSNSTPLSAYAFDEDRFVTTSESTVQWDDDVLHMTGTVPGVLIVDIIDSGSESLTATLYADANCAAAAELSSANLTPTSGRLTAVVYAAVNQLKLEPYQSASGDYEVAVRLFAPCGLGETDDHGDTAMCATAIAVDGHEDGEIDNTSSDDEDFFAFSLSSQEDIVIETSGTTDTYGSLYDASGQLLEADDDDGTDSNFYIARTLGAGRYFVRVEGAGGDEGSYGIDVDVAP